MTYRPITHRALQWLANTLSVPPVLAGIVCSLIFGMLAMWFTWITGVVADVQAGRAPEIAVRAPVTLFIIVGYLPMALYYLWLWTGNHLQTIASRFSLDGELIAFPRLAANWLGAAGVVVVYFSFLHRPDDTFLLFQPLRWDADFAFTLVGLIAMGWFYFRFMFLLIWCALTVSRTAQRIRTIDLFDTSLVKPYGQHGVRSSLLAIISLSISANLWLDPDSPVIGTATSVVMLVGATVLSLVLPTWGMHQRLAAVKQSEIKKVRDAITLRSDPKTRSVDDAHQLRADLALEQRLAEVSEWPFDAGSYGRVSLYILLGFGSWVGAALVERLLESFGA